MQLTRMQGKTVMSCQRSLANDAGGCCWCYVLQCYAYTMVICICLMYILSNDAGGAAGVMTPRLLTSPPFLVQGDGDDE